MDLDLLVRKPGKTHTLILQVSGFTRNLENHKPPDLQNPEDCALAVICFFGAEVICWVPMF